MQAVRWRMVTVFSFQMMAMLATSTRAEALPEPPAAMANAATAVDSAEEGGTVGKDGSRARLSGQVLELGTRAPLAGAQVVLPDLATETYTDGEGRFAFDDLPAGLTTVLLPGADHLPLRAKVQVPAAGEATLLLRPERSSYVVYRASATAPRAPGEVSRRSLSREEIARVPGVYGDSFKVVSNLPGVSRTGGFSGQIVVRGSAPAETQTLVEGVGIPQLYHFGGLYSVFNTDVLSGVDFQPGPQSARIGRRTGGLIEARLAPPPAEAGWHAAVEANAFHAGGILSGPLGANSHLTVAARRSYIDGLLATVVPAEVLPFTVVPRYYDYQAKLDHRLSSRVNATFLLFGSDDAVRAVVDKPPAAFPDARGGISAATSFLGGIGVLRYGGDKWRGQTTVGVVPSTLKASAGNAIRFDLTATDYTLRQDLSRQWAHVTVRTGMDWLWTPYQIALKLPFAPSTGEPGTASGVASTTVALSQAGSFYAPGVWLDTVLRPATGLEVVPGVRLDFYRGYTGAGDQRQVQRIDSTISPRLAIRQELGSQWTLKLAGGLTSQRPEPQQLGQDIGNPDLRAIRGAEINAGAVWRPSEALELDLQLFDKRLWNMVVANGSWPASGVPFTNDGTGHVRGLEVLVRHKPVGRFFGWVSYTLQRATRIDHPGEVERLFGWDQTHILTALGSYKLPGNWEVGARWRWVTGSPYTGVASATWNANDDTWRQVPATCVNCERLPAFHQLDLRVDKTWALDNYLLSAYLDVQNAYNHANPESVQYSFDARQKTYATGLPVIPSFGLRGEF